MKKREKERIAYQRLHTLGEGTPNYMKSLTRQIRTIFKQTTTNKEEKKSPERKKRSKSPKQNTSEVKIHTQNPKTPKPQNPKTPKPQNPKTPKPQNPKTPKPQNP